MDTPRDDFEGHGGSYLVGADGKRQLIERTKSRESEVRQDIGQGSDIDQHSDTQGD